MKRHDTPYGFTSRYFPTIVLCFLAVLILPGPGRSDPSRRELENLRPSFRESVLRGWRYFQTSFAEDGVACVHCHRDHSDMVFWSGSYPKVQLFDGTPYEVKTLRTVIMEAMARHTDAGPVESSEMAEDLQAYIAWWGDGQPLTPGTTSESTPPEEDLAELEKAAVRGRSLFNREKPVSCSHCHTIQEPQDGYLVSLKDILVEYPKSASKGERATSLDIYLLGHYRRQGVVMSARNITDISAYLAQLSRGATLRPGGQPLGEEVLP